MSNDMTTGLALGFALGLLLMLGITNAGWQKHNTRYHSDEWQQCAAARGTWECPSDRRPQ